MTASKLAIETVGTRNTSPIARPCSRAASSESATSSAAWLSGMRPDKTNGLLTSVDVNRPNSPKSNSDSTPVT